MREPYILIKSNYQNYIGIGPLFGVVNDTPDDYLYIKLNSIEDINKYIDYIYDNINTKIELYYFVFSNETLRYGEEVFISENLYNEFLDINPQLEFYTLEEIEIVPNHTNLFPYINREISFSEDELKALCHTFCDLILTLADEANIDETSNYNLAYKKALEYFRDYEFDAGLENINIILNTISFDYIDSNNMVVPSTSCGNCNTSVLNTSNGQSTNNNLLNNYQTLSCLDKYKEAMKLWLAKMLGDVNFYNDWFFISDNDETVVNETLIDHLIKLLEEFLALDLRLTFSSKSNHCYCEDLSYDKETEENIKTINNYIKVLNYIKECKIEENQNKIKLYGETFGTLLPKLNF